MTCFYINQWPPYVDVPPALCTDKFEKLANGSEGHMLGLSRLNMQGSIEVRWSTTKRPPCFSFDMCQKCVETDGQLEYRACSLCHCWSKMAFLLFLTSLMWKACHVHVNACPSRVPFREEFIPSLLSGYVSDMQNPLEAQIVIFRQNSFYKINGIISLDCFLMLFNC